MKPLTRISNIPLIIFSIGAGFRGANMFKKTSGYEEKNYGAVNPLSICYKMQAKILSRRVLTLAKHFFTGRKM
jgi:hypothetical protein